MVAPRNEMEHGFTHRIPTVDRPRYQKVSHFLRTLRAAWLAGYHNLMAGRLQSFLQTTGLGAFASTLAPLKRNEASAGQWQLPTPARPR